MKAGALRHHVSIEASSTVQDNYGTLTTTWTPFAYVYAAIEPLSVKDFIHAQQLTSRLTTRITIRFRRDVMRAGIRLIGPDDTIYTPIGILPDPMNGRTYLTLPCISEMPC